MSISRLVGTTIWVISYQQPFLTMNWNV